MAEKKEEKGGISPALLVTGAVGLGLVIFGLSKLGGPKAKNINAKFEFDHVGPATDIKLRVRFGDSRPLGDFGANSDLVKETAPIPIDAHEDPTRVVLDVPMVVPAKQKFGFWLPYTYDGEAMILNTGGNLIDDLKVVTENVFTHTADFQVEML